MPSTQGEPIATDHAGRRARSRHVERAATRRARARHDEPDRAAPTATTAISAWVNAGSTGSSRKSPAGQTPNTCSPSAGCSRLPSAVALVSERRGGRQQPATSAGTGTRQAAPRRRANAGARASAARAPAPDSEAERRRQDRARARSAPPPLSTPSSAARDDRQRDQRPGGEAPADRNAPASAAAAATRAARGHLLDPAPQVVADQERRLRAPSAAASGAEPGSAHQPSPPAATAPGSSSARQNAMYGWISQATSCPTSSRPIPSGRKPPTG